MESKKSKDKYTPKSSRYGRKINLKKKYSNENSDEESPRNLSGENENLVNRNVNDCGKILKHKESPRKNSSDLEERGTVVPPKTPYSFRQRLKNRIQTEIEIEEMPPFDISEESEWEETETESSLSDEEVGGDLSESLLPKNVKPNVSIKHKSHYVCCSSDYIDKSSGKSISSSVRLKRLEEVDKFSDILSSFVSPHSTHISSLCKRNHSLYYKWMYALSKGYNIVIYGLGSKKLLLDMFQSTCLQTCRVLLITGFFPGLTIKHLLSSLFELIDGKFKESVEGLFSLLDQINAPRIFIVIHNIDGVSLRQDKIQLFLSQLASRKKVHIIASIDHINAPLLWDQKKSSQFNFIWEDCTSYLPYTKEMCYENSLIAQSSTSLALSSLRNVYRSLNKNSKQVFAILLEHSLASGSKNSGMQFSELYRLCRRNFIVSSDLALRTQLTEFVDHQLIKWKKETDTLCMCVENDVLKNFKSEIDNNEL